MSLSQLHFAHTAWLSGLLLIPIVCLLYWRFYHGKVLKHRLDQFIDSHLLIHLLQDNHQGQHRKIWRSLCIWSFLWVLLIGALAGPRWNYHKISTFTNNKSLVILLDLSHSMNTDDVKLSRLARAKQEIDDLLSLSRGIKIGLIAFAADAHMITPLTDDMQTIRHLLPFLDTDVVYIQGSLLTPALSLAAQLLKAEPGNNKSIVIVTDGGFSDMSAIIKARELANSGLTIHTMGIGTTTPTPIKNSFSELITHKGSIVFSKLEEQRLRDISRAGRGLYVKAHFSDNDSMKILNQISRQIPNVKTSMRQVRYWQERFYLLLLPFMAVIIFWFRKGMLFPILIITLYLPSHPTHAARLSDYFKNDAQLGQEAYAEKDYQSAMKKFRDPYRLGIVQYKMGHFNQAAQLFQQSKRPEVAQQSAYNMANALAWQQKYEEAINAYERVLENWPDNKKAKDDLELVKKILKHKKQEKQEKHDNNHAGNNQNNNKAEKQQQQKNKQAKKKSDKAHNKQQTQRKTEENEQDRDADQWLNHAMRDQKTFFKNQFYIESKRSGTKENEQPW